MPRASLSVQKREGQVDCLRSQNGSEGKETYPTMPLPAPSYIIIVAITFDFSHSFPTSPQQDVEKNVGAFKHCFPA